MRTPPGRLRSLIAGLALASVPSACTAQPDTDERGPTTPVRELTECRVTRIVDGDTLDCDPVGRVRMIGMDTPERAQRPFGESATAALADLIPRDGVISLEADVEASDRFDRALRYVWADGRLVNWVMVRRGYAVLLTFPPNVQYVDQLTAAQEAARGEGAGLWGVDGFACPPQEYRRRACR
jgi:micrococcal nuclease